MANLKEIQIKAKTVARQNEILTEGALEFLARLHNHFNERRVELLTERKIVQKELNHGKKLDFLEQTEHIRNSNWTIPPLPKDLEDRRVEITGPVDRKMIIHALNSGAKVFMADFEDATSPSWENIINGQINLKDAVRREIDFVAGNGKEYRLKNETAVLVVRPRGWHLEEKHLSIDNVALSASLVDFGLYFYHNAAQLIQNGTGPYFYLPKLESYLEARLWNDVFIFVQTELGIPIGTIKATVLIETISAAFQMDEILYELKEHSAGLNCGRWDYIFSFIKKFHQQEEILFPDRATVTMEVPFMRAYSLLAIKTCHRRNAPAIGGMAAQIPVKGNEKANQNAFDKVRADKEREVHDGHDGTWVAHPGMVPLVKEVFDKRMTTPNQIYRKLEQVDIKSQELLEVPKGVITEAGLRTNISVSIEYIASWLRGKGAVPINHLMEDAATAEISRAQVWQWIRHPKGIIEDGTKVTLELVEGMMREEMNHIRDRIGEELFTVSKYVVASEIFLFLVRNDYFIEFLTLPAYEELINEGRKIT